MHLDITRMKKLDVGNKVQLSGGYDYDPIYLKKPQASKRTGTIIQFIKGQNTMDAAVVKLDEIIYGEKLSGDIVVLELRQVGATWLDSKPIVHIELCDFIPENKPWKDRRQGEWVEAAATLAKV